MQLSAYSYLLDAYKWIPPPGCKCLITEGNPYLTLIPMICITHFFKVSDMQIYLKY